MKDWWAQVITLNTAIFTLTVTFLRPNGRLCWPGALVASWVCQILSLFFAMLKLWAWSSPTSSSQGDLIWLRNCARAFAESRWVSLGAIVSFGFGLFLLLAFGIRNILQARTSAPEGESP